MSFESSIAARNSLLDKLKADLDGGKLYIDRIGGGIPGVDDDVTARSGDILVTITVDGLGTGLTFETSAAGVLLKETTETWLGTIAISDIASFYRFKAAGDLDTAGSIATNIRLQGTVGVLNADLLVADVNFTVTEDQRVDYYAVGLPTTS